MGKMGMGKMGMMRMGMMKNRQPMGVREPSGKMDKQPKTRTSMDNENDSKPQKMKKSSNLRYSIYNFP
jgi:hypothetical protein